MRTTGEVVKVYNNTAVVRIELKSACGHECTNCGACKAKYIEAEALNTLGAKIGDRVIIESESQGILKIAFLLYILPVLIIIFAGIFARLTSISNIYNSVIFILLFILWFLGLRFYNNRKVQKNSIIKIF